MAELSPEELEDLLPGYVLEILDPDELALVEAALAGRPEYRARVLELQQAVTWLPYAAPEAPPLAPEVKPRTLARIRSERQRSLRRPAAPAPSAPTRSERLRRAFAVGWAPALAAACLVLALGLGVRLARVQRDLTAAQTALIAQQSQQAAEVARLTSALAQRDSDLARLTTQLAQAQAEAGQIQQQISLLTRANALVTLAPQPGAPASASARVYITDDQRALVVAQGLPTPRPGRVYELWGIGTAGPIPMGTYSVTPGNPTTWVVDPAISARDFSAFGVTEEPDGGSPTPTPPILLLGQRAS
ncbi:MAG: anti-sigma factor [Anaerolineae bacterium]|nr:anti-sigma factor [Anaerolineae bacterium]